MPPEAPSTSISMTLHLLHHLTTIFSMVVEEHLVSCNIMIDGFSSDINLFKNLFLLWILRSLMFQEIYFIEKVGGGMRISFPYS